MRTARSVATSSASPSAVAPGADERAGTRTEEPQPESRPQHEPEHEAVEAERQPEPQPGSSPTGAGATCRSRSSSRSRSRGRRDGRASTLVARPAARSLTSPPRLGRPLRFNGGMEKAERDAILRQGIVLPETPRDRARARGARGGSARASLAGQARAPPAPDTSGRGPTRTCAASRGPLHYMLRLHAIERRTEALEEDLRERWRALAAECDGDRARFARALDDRGPRGRLRRGQRPRRAPQPLVPGRVPAADGPAHGRLRARERPRLPAPAARRELGARAVPARSTTRSPPESARARRCRGEWPHDARRARAHRRGPGRARARRPPVRPVRDPRVPPRRPPPRPERADELYLISPSEVTEFVAQLGIVFLSSSSASSSASRG